MSCAIAVTSRPTAAGLRRGSVNLDYDGPGVRNVPLVGFGLTDSQRRFSSMGVPIRQPTNVQVVGTTTTQAILSYQAPDGNRCTVTVSENSNYTPAVADVDPNKFAGSNSDSRFSALDQGLVRYFVVGTVPKPSGLIANQAADGYYYGRALKPNTQHYFQITCDGSPASGTTSFTE